MKPLHRICLALILIALPYSAQADVAPSLRSAAEQGDAQAQYELGRAYESGSQVPQDDFQAVRWLKAAAQQDHPQAAMDYGWMLTNGYGLPRDLEQAYFWFARAAALGAEGALDQRDAVARTLPEAVRAQLYTQAVAGLPLQTPIDEQSAPALKADGDPVLGPADSFESLRDQLNDGGTFALLAKLRLLADDGDPRAANLIGLALLRSTDPKDEAAGLDWIYGAARAGLPAAQYNMARQVLDRAGANGTAVDAGAVTRWLDMAWAGSKPADPTDYTAVAQEFAARAGLKDPYRAAVQGSDGTHVELRELIRVARQDLIARRDLDRRKGTAGAVGSGIETTVIE